MKRYKVSYYDWGESGTEENKRVTHVNTYKKDPLLWHVAHKKVIDILGHTKFDIQMIEATGVQKAKTVEDQYKRFMK